MLNRFGAMDRTLSVFDELRRRMDRVWDDFDHGGHPPQAHPTESTWPHVNLYDAGASLVLIADVPGMGDKDMEISIGEGALSIEGERKVEPPHGYAVHRRERAPIRFARSFVIPARIDTDHTTAVVKDGVLTITMPKAADAQPRRVAIRST
jgi:HSP20 family protein